MNEDVLMSNDPIGEEAPKQELQKLELPLNQVVELHEHDVHESSASESESNRSTTFNGFEKALESINDSEKKLDLAIQFLETALSQPTSPNFKDFWNVRKICLELFHTNINPAVRITLWGKYSTLCQEAKRLKDIYVEQSAFNA